MAQSKNIGASGTSVNEPTVEEIKQWYSEHKNDYNNKKNFALSDDAIKILRDIAKGIDTRSISTINKEELKIYLKNIGGSEKKLRETARYLYYRSNIFFRIINWYAGMWNLGCRKITPSYSIGGNNTPKTMLNQYNKTLDMLDIMNMQNNMTEMLITSYVQDVVYAIALYDKTGMFFYQLDPDECIIDSRYQTGDFGFAIQMSKWSSPKRQAIIEAIGSPLKEMWEEYNRTKAKYIHVPDEYASCFKFRTDTWDMVVPPLLSTFLQLASLEDLVDIQAEADALSIYKLIYLPMTVHSSGKDTDDFEYTPDLQQKYFNRMIAEGVIPDGIGAAMVPAEELKTIDFSKSVDSDTNSVELASNQVLQTAGGGAVINSNNITSTAAFNAWLKAETQFAMSTLLPQIEGFVNRFLNARLNNPAKVSYFEVSVYTQKDLADQLLSSCQYSFPNRLAYGTLINVSERETLTMLYFENEVLKLPELMKYPLASSYTATGDTEDEYTSEVGQGAPQKDDGELTESGDRMRNS